MAGTAVSPHLNLGQLGETHLDGGQTPAVSSETSLYSYTDWHTIKHLQRLEDIRKITVTVTFLAVK